MKEILLVGFSLMLYDFKCLFDEIMATSGHAWPYMAIHGHVWPCMAMHGHAWPWMAIYGHVWPCMAMHGHIWPCLAMSGHAWPYTAMSGNARPCMAIYGHVHAYRLIRSWLPNADHGPSPPALRFLQSEWTLCRLTPSWLTKSGRDAPPRPRLTRPTRMTRLG